MVITLQNRNKKIFIISGLLLALALLIFLSFNIHSHHTGTSWKSEIYADKAGYYVYLPATFIYGFKANAFPGNIDSLTGNGFKLDHESNKVITKYPAGTAILQAPFFLLTHCMAKPLGFDNDGFSTIYYKMVNIAAIFYLLAGLAMLFLFLKKFLPPTFAFLALLIVFAGTNLYYYALNDTGMSHVYSFFAFSGLLYFSGKICRSSRSIPLEFITAGLFAGLIIAIRPVNVLFFVFILLYFRKYLWNHLYEVYKPKKLFKLLYLIIPAILMVIPQMAYNHYLSGSLLHYSYGNESFSNWNQPKLMPIWFSTNNGLFTYNPVLLFAIAGMFFIPGKSYGGLWLNLLYFLFISYAFSSWWSWWYGCSYGSRVFVEYYVFLSIPLGYMLVRIKYSGSRFLQYFLFSLIVAFCIYNIILIYHYPKCWFWGTWDWKSLFELFAGRYPQITGFNL